MNGPPNLILLHGALGSQKQFDPLIEILGTHFMIHTFDLPGHGGSPIPEKFSIPLFADALMHFMETHHLGPVYVFGYSMGGYIALQVSKDHPGAISKIMTLGTMLKWSPEIAEKEVRMMNPEIIEAKIPKFAEQLNLRHAPQDWKTIMTKTAEMMLGLGNGEAMTLEEFEKIETPILVGLGSLDQMAAKEDSIEVAEHLPNGRFHCFEGFKHPIEAVNVAVLAHSLKDYFAPTP